MTRFSVFLLATASFAFAQAPATPAKSFTAQFEDLNRRLLEMAKDFPEAKYGYRATKDVRSFAEIVVHVSSGNAYAAKAGRGEKANWDEIDPKGYTSKTAMVALLEKTIADANATLKAVPDDRWAKTVAALAGRDRARRRTLWTACGLLPQQRNGAAGVASKEVIRC